MKFTEEQIEIYSRQITLKKIGPIGQKKLLTSKILIIGMGGLGSPAAIYLARMGVGNIGIVDNDKIDLSNLHRQILFDKKDIKKNKVQIVKTKLNRINSDVKIDTFNTNINEKNIDKIAKKYSLIIDGSDNFKTKFLLNDYCIKNKKILIIGAINKFDGHIFTFNFKNRIDSPCLRCFINNSQIEDTSCERDGIIGSLAGIVGSIQANETIKELLNIGQSLCGYILIIDSLKLKFKKIKLNKNENCICNKNI